MSNFTYSLVKSPEVITGKTVYHGVVQTNGTLDRDMIAQRLAVRTKQDVALWRYFLDALNDELAEEILAGYRVNLGQLSTGFAIKGSFQSEDERWDAEKHQLIPTVRTLDPLHSALKAVKPENITLGLTCTVYSAMDSVTKRLNEITGTNLLLLQGINLGVNTENPDEFVVLVDPETDEVKATATVVRSDAVAGHPQRRRGHRARPLRAQLASAVGPGLRAQRQASKRSTSEAKKSRVQRSSDGRSAE